MTIGNWIWLAIMGAVIMLGRRMVPPAIETMARAILDFEGWYEGSRSQRNNNPGNLKFRGQPGTANQLLIMNWTVENTGTTTTDTITCMTYLVFL